MGLLERIFSVDWFHLEPEYFPKDTKDIFDLTTIKKVGVLALGTKKMGNHKSLNVGFLDPRSREARAAADAALKKDPHLKKYRAYRIQPEGYLTVLQQVYGVFPAQFTENPQEANPTILAYLAEMNKENQKSS